MDLYDTICSSTYSKCLCGEPQWNSECLYPPQDESLLQTLLGLYSTSIYTQYISPLTTKLFYTLRSELQSIWVFLSNSITLSVILSSEITLEGDFSRSLRTSTELKDTLHVNIQTYKDFFLFYRSTYSTVGYPKYQYISLHLLYEPLRGAFGILDNICFSMQNSLVEVDKTSLSPFE